MTEGSDKDIREEYVDILTGVGKLKDYQLKIHVNKDITPIAQQVWRLPFGLRDRVDQKLDDLLDKDIIEEGTKHPYIVGVTLGCSSKARWGHKDMCRYETSNTRQSYGNDTPSLPLKKSCTILMDQQFSASWTFGGDSIRLSWTRSHGKLQCL